MREFDIAVIKRDKMPSRTWKNEMTLRLIKYFWKKQEQGLVKAKESTLYFQLFRLFEKLNYPKAIIADRKDLQVITEILAANVFTKMLKALQKAGLVAFSSGRDNYKTTLTIELVEPKY